MGSLVLVGRCYLSGDLVDQDAERSLPHSDGCALLRCQSVLPFSVSAISQTTKSLVHMTCPANTLYAATVPCFWLFRSGSYASPVTHNRCSSTASFRATAITARFLAFFPPRSQM